MRFFDNIVELFYFIISLALPVAGGTFFVRWLLRGDSKVRWGEALFFGIAVGSGLLVFWMFLVGIAGIPFGRASVGLPLLLFAAVFFKMGARDRTAGPSRTADIKGGWRRYLMAIMAVWVAAKIGFVFYESLLRPLNSVDSFLNWAISAKFFYYNAGLVLDPSNEHFLGRGYRFFIGHPLHLPLIQTWIAIVLGRFHELYIKAPVALYFVGTLGVLYYAVRREAGPLYAMVTVFFMASVPILTGQGLDAYADLPLAFFALSATVALWRFLRDDSLCFLTLSGILFGMVIFVKNEGLFFPLAGGMALTVFLLFRKRASSAPFIVPITAFILPIVVLAGPWFLFKSHYDLGFGHSGTFSGFKWFSDPFYSGNEGHGVHWEVLTTGLRSIFFTANYNLIFPLWIFAGILARKSFIRRELKYLYMIILLVTSMFLFVYLTLEVTAVTQQTGIHRNTLTYLPIVFFATALALSSLWPDLGQGLRDNGVET